MALVAMIHWHRCCDEVEEFWGGDIDVGSGDITVTRTFVTVKERVVLRE